MQRRTFIKKSSLVALSASTLSVLDLKGSTPKDGKLLHVNQQRIENRIKELSKYGQNEQGHGYRVAYTKGDIEGRKWFMGLMKNAGLDVSIDCGGNIIGKRKGKNSSLKPIAFGSHIDMVPDGGNYDGCLGSISALEAIEVMNESKHITNHPLEVIIFANEEGGLVGSQIMVGNFKEEGLKEISQSGLTMAEGIKGIGGNPENIRACVRNKGDVHAFVELHIEQGGTLEKENKQIGVVEGIVGIVDWIVTVEGFANHAGTTVMSLRQDALLAASKFIIAVNEVITSVEGNQVGTVGKIHVVPDAFNVIPGKATLSLEIRDLSFDKIEMLFKEIEKRADEIAKSSKTKISFERLATSSKPALTDRNLQQKINDVAISLNLSTRFMPSGAGHDTQQMSFIAPVAMIFVPSVGGISHSFKEFTKSEDLANGANVLLNTILAIDKD
jgi:N-carbamoyl-L-amino-acid hydrolase